MPEEEAKTKKQLVAELEKLRKQVKQLKSLESEFKVVERELRNSEHQYRQLFEGAQHGIVILDADTGNIKRANPHLLKMLGYTHDDLLGKNLWDMEAFIDTEKSRAAAHHLKQQDHLRYEDFPLETRNGRRLDVEIESTVCQINDNRVVHCNIRDTTERKRLERELRLVATHDTMTGLPNRTLFRDRAQIALLHAQRSKKKVAVLSLDLDKFNTVNETMGNAVGDNLLKAAAERMTGLLRKSDTVARVGGDEFAIVVPEIEDIRSVDKVNHKIVDAFRHHFLVNGHKILVTVSVGTSVFPDDGRDIDTLINCADKCMYYVRSNGCNNYKISPGQK
ncbi:MAG: sensor domain-containing diguanylate cyclase [Dehalococcoidia bacterium]|jgi:GGDEF domain-containing protein